MLTSVVTTETPRLHARRSNNGRDGLRRGSGGRGHGATLASRCKSRAGTMVGMRENPGGWSRDRCSPDEVTDELGVVAAHGVRRTRRRRARRAVGRDPRLVLVRAEAAQVLAAIERATGARAGRGAADARPGAPGGRAGRRVSSAACAPIWSRRRAERAEPVGAASPSPSGSRTWPSSSTAPPRRAGSRASSPPASTGWCASKGRRGGVEASRWSCRWARTRCSSPSPRPSTPCSTSPRASARRRCGCRPSRSRSTTHGHRRRSHRGRERRCGDRAQPDVRRRRRGRADPRRLDARGAPGPVRARRPTRPAPARHFPWRRPWCTRSATSVDQAQGSGRLSDTVAARRDARTRRRGRLGRARPPRRLAGRATGVGRGARARSSRTCPRTRPRTASSCSRRRSWPGTCGTTRRSPRAMDTVLRQRYPDAALSGRRGRWARVPAGSDLDRVRAPLEPTRRR